jgi:hypothetical protein
MKGRTYRLSRAREHGRPRHTRCRERIGDSSGMAVVRPGVRFEQRAPIGGRVY